MISKQTVLILGAGASAPYNFNTGKTQLDWARNFKVEDLALEILPIPKSLAPGLLAHLLDTGERSIDAMLRRDSEYLPPAKALIARDLLRSERNLLSWKPEPPTYWYRSLFTNLPRNTLPEFRASPLKIFTYNYDRSLDYFLWRAIASCFPGISNDEIADILNVIGPFHLHGQLGRLYPEALGMGDVVEYGGDHSMGGITESDVASAITQIKLISETTMLDAPFVHAQQAIADAERLVFLGFSFHPDNLAKLRISENPLKPSTEVFCSAFGLTEQETGHMKQRLGSSFASFQFGGERDDIMRYLGMHPAILG